MTVKLPVCLFMIFLLTACQSAPGQPKQVYPAVTQNQQKQNFMEIGRGLSHGAVDLYQPGSDFLDAPQQPASPRSTFISPIPGNPNILVNSPNVTIYSLDTMEVSEPKPAPLPPGVSDVQAAPVSLMTDDDSSPFDKNGNMK